MIIEAFQKEVGFGKTQLSRGLNLNSNLKNSYLIRLAILVACSAIVLCLVAPESYALIPERRRLFEDRRENVYMIIPAIASLPGSGVFVGLLGSFSNIAGSGIDAAVTKAETIGEESDIHLNAFALREIPLLIPGLTFEYWFGDITLDDYNYYLPGRDSPSFTIPYTAEFDYFFLHPVWRFWERRINLSYFLAFFKGFYVDEDGFEQPIAIHSATGEILFDFTDDVIDPSIGIRIGYDFSIKAPENSILGENSHNAETDEGEVYSKKIEFAAYFPLTDLITLVYFHQRFLAEGREKSDDVIPGGSISLRGYPGGRWSDRYGEMNAVEGRYTIPTNIDIDIYLVHGVLEGIQLAAFYEAGQVSPVADEEDLYKDLHHSYGFGLRALLEAIVLRLDLAYSDEGTQTHLTIDQPF